MPNPENLKNFPKGVSGNPAGKPKGTRNRSTVVKEMLEKAAIGKFKGMQNEAFGEEVEAATIQDQVVASLILKAINGDVAATKELLDSAHGKLTEKIDNTHDYKKMESVEVKVVEDSGNVKPAALEFDVGGEALHDKEE